MSVVVERSGGFAGLSRRWSATPAETEAERWRHLLDACPWDAESRADRTEGADGADRFSWEITVAAGSTRHHVRLSEAAADGPWRQLIEAVRAASAAEQ